MKFLPDVNIPPSLCERLKLLDHTYRWVHRWVPICMHPTATDLSIIEEALTTGEVILTHDTDFGTLLSFFNTNKPSVVLFRIDKVNTERFFTLLINNWSVISQPLSDGA